MQDRIRTQTDAGNKNKKNYLAQPMSIEKYPPTSTQFPHHTQTTQPAQQTDTTHQTNKNIGISHHRMRNSYHRRPRTKKHKRLKQAKLKLNTGQQQQHTGEIHSNPGHMMGRQYSNTG